MTLCGGKRHSSVRRFTAPSNSIHQNTRSPQKAGFLMEDMVPVDNYPFSVDNSRHKGITVAMQSAQTNKTGNTAAKTGRKQAPARKSPRGTRPTGAPLFFSLTYPYTVVVACAGESKSGWLAQLNTRAEVTYKVFRVFHSTTTTTIN